MQLKRTTFSRTLKGSKFERKTKSLFKSKFGNKGHICVVVAVAVLVAKGPYSIRTSAFYNTKDALRESQGNRLRNCKRNSATQHCGQGSTACFSGPMVQWPMVHPEGWVHRACMPFSWLVKIATTKDNQETAHAKHAG